MEDKINDIYEGSSNRDKFGILIEMYKEANKIEDSIERAMCYLSIITLANLYQISKIDKMINLLEKLVGEKI